MSVWACAFAYFVSLCFCVIAEWDSTSSRSPFPIEIMLYRLCGKCEVCCVMCNCLCGCLHVCALCGKSEHCDVMGCSLCWCMCVCSVVIFINMTLRVLSECYFLMIGTEMYKLCNLSDLSTTQNGILLLSLWTYHVPHAWATQGMNVRTLKVLSLSLSLTIYLVYQTNNHGDD